MTDRTHIFINSRNRLPFENSSSFIVNLPNGLIYGDGQTQYRMTVNYFQTCNSWYNIQSNYNNKFVLSTDNFDTSTDFFLDIGNPSVYDLLSELQTKLADYCDVSYSKSLNRYIFTNKTGSTLYFNVVDCGQFLGFKNGNVYSFDTDLMSDTVINMLGDELLIMRVRGDISFENSTIENITTSEFYPSDILFTFPVNVPPFSLITWENTTLTRFTHTINSQSKSIDQFIIDITNEDGNIIPDFSNYTLHLMIEKIVDENEFKNSILSSLNSLLEYIKEIYLMIGNYFTQ